MLLPTQCQYFHFFSLGTGIQLIQSTAKIADLHFRFFRFLNLLILNFFFRLTTQENTKLGLVEFRYNRTP